MYLHDIFGTYLPQQFVLQAVFQFLLSCGGSLKVGHEEILKKSSHSSTPILVVDRHFMLKKVQGFVSSQGAHSLCNIICFSSGNKALLGEHLNISLRIKRSNFQPAQGHTHTHDLRKTQGHERKGTV